MNQEIGKKLLSILKVEQVKKDEPMKIHTTFRVGGPASYFVTPETEEEGVHTGKCSLLYSRKWK